MRLTQNFTLGISVEHMEVVSGTAVVIARAKASNAAHVPDSPPSASHLLTRVRSRASNLNTKRQWSVVR